MKDISELIVNDADTWQEVQEWIGNAHASVEVLETTRANGEETLYRLQVTNRSTLGAIALETGGLIVDHGWLCLLGAGHPRIHGSLRQNRQHPLLEEGFVVAYDVVGGLFALNTGRFDPQSAHVYYFAPDTLEWEDTEKGYTDFVDWVLNGDLDTYYSTFRWKSWIEDLKAMTPGQGIAVYPFLWTAEGRDMERNAKRPVAIEEVWESQYTFRAQLGERG